MRISTNASFPPVVAAALFRMGDQTHRILRRYKDAPVAEGRRHFEAALARAFDSFLSGHGTCLQVLTGGWEAVALVPSSRVHGVPGSSHPLGHVVEQVPALACFERVEIRKGAGDVRHLAARRDAFEVVDPVRRSRRVLVIDDTWTTGARAMSAVATLESAGARVAGVLVGGRSVDPSVGPDVSRWWLTASRRGAAATHRCALGAGPDGDS